jgi:predicted DNA-binding transcriptional regulator AlpA
MKLSERNIYIKEFEEASDDTLLTIMQVAAYFGISERTLYRARSTEKHELESRDFTNIPCLKIGKSVRYMKKDVLNYVKQRIQKRDEFQEMLKSLDERKVAIRNKLMEEENF